MAETISASASTASFPSSIPARSPNAMRPFSPLERVMFSHSESSSTYNGAEPSQSRTRRHRRESSVVDSAVYASPAATTVPERMATPNSSPRPLPPSILRRTSSSTLPVHSEVDSTPPHLQAPTMRRRSSRVRFSDVPLGPTNPCPSPTGTSASSTSANASSACSSISTTSTAGKRTSKSGTEAAGAVAASEFGVLRESPSASAPDYGMRRIGSIERIGHSSVFYHTLLGTPQTLSASLPISSRPSPRRSFSAQTRVHNDDDVDAFQPRPLLYPKMSRQLSRLSSDTQIHSTTGRTAPATATTMSMSMATPPRSALPCSPPPSFPPPSPFASATETHSHRVAYSLSRSSLIAAGPKAPAPELMNGPLSPSITVTPDDSPLALLPSHVSHGNVDRGDWHDIDLSAGAGAGLPSVLESEVLPSERTPGATHRHRRNESTLSAIAGFPVPPARDLAIAGPGAMREEKETQAVDGHAAGEGEGDEMGLRLPDRLMVSLDSPTPGASSFPCTYSPDGWSFEAVALDQHAELDEERMSGDESTPTNEQTPAPGYEQHSLQEERGSRSVSAETPSTSTEQMPDEEQGMSSDGHSELESDVNECAVSHPTSKERGVVRSSSPALCETMRRKRPYRQRASSDADADADANTESSESELDLHEPLLLSAVKSRIVSPHSRLLAKSQTPASVASTAAGSGSGTGSTCGSGSPAARRLKRQTSLASLRAGVSLTRGQGWSGSEAEEDEYAEAVRRIALRRKRTASLSLSLSSPSLSLSLSSPPHAAHSHEQGSESASVSSASSRLSDVSNLSSISSGSDSSSASSLSSAPPEAVSPCPGVKRHAPIILSPIHARSALHTSASMGGLRMGMSLSTMPPRPQLMHRPSSGSTSSPGDYPWGGSAPGSPVKEYFSSSRDEPKGVSHKGLYEALVALPSADTTPTATTPTATTPTATGATSASSAGTGTGTGSSTSASTPGSTSTSASGSTVKFNSVALPVPRKIVRGWGKPEVLLDQRYPQRQEPAPGQGHGQVQGHGQGHGQGQGQGQHGRGEARPFVWADDALPDLTPQAVRALASSVPVPVVKSAVPSSSSSSYRSTASAGPAGPAATVKMGRAVRGGREALLRRPSTGRFANMPMI